MLLFVNIYSLMIFQNQTFWVTKASLHLVGCSLRRKGAEIDVITAGLWAQGRPVKVTLYQHKAKAKAVWDWYSSKSPDSSKIGALVADAECERPERTTSTLQSLSTGCAVMVCDSRHSVIEICTSAAAMAHAVKLLVKHKSESTDRQRNGS